MNTRRLIINGVLALAIAGCAIGGYLVVSNKKTAVASTTTVVTAGTGNVLSSVSGSGNVLAPIQMDVSFDSAVSSNKVTEITVKVGDKVKAGQAVARVDNAAATTALTVAQAQLAQAQATFNKAQNPITPEVKAQDDATLTQANVSLQNAKVAVTNAQNTLANDTALQDAAVAQATDAVTAAQAKAALDLSNQQASVDQAQATLDADAMKQTTAQAAYDAAKGTPGETAAKAALDNAVASVAKDTTALTAAKNQLASLQLSTATSVGNAQNALANAQNGRESKLNADQLAIDSTKRQLTSAQASYNGTVANIAAKEKVPTADDLAGQQVSLLNAQNALATAQKNLDNTTLRAPIDGTVATLNGKLNFVASSTGSSASGSSGSGGGSTSSSSSSSTFLTLSDLNSLQVKIGFSESDATNVKVGLGSTITFDSLTGVNATGKVISLDLTSTTVSNVVTYYAYVALDQAPTLAQVKPGMTASVVVVVNHADGVVTLPASAVSARGTTATVNVLKANDPKVTTPTPITLGLRGDSTVEVKTGLKAGDKIAIVRQSATGVGTTGTRTGTATVTGGLGGGAVVPGGGAGPRPGG